MTEALLVSTFQLYLDVSDLVTAIDSWQSTFSG